MKKTLKYIAYAVGAVVMLALLLVLTLPLWLGTIFRPAVCVAVPKITQTSFEMSKLYLNPYTGRFELGGFVLGNPKGYSEPVAASISNLVVDVAMTTLADKYVHVEEVMVEGVFVSYISGGEHDVDNFTQIQYNVKGGKEKFEEAKKQAELKKKAEAEAAEEVEDVAEEVSERKLVIDKLTVRNVRVKYGFLTIPVPVDIVLTDIGKDSGGATISEVCEKVWQAILKSAGAIGNGASSLSRGVNNAVDGAMDKVGEGARKTTDAVKKLLNF